MKFLSLLFLFLFSIDSKAQILDQYPENQVPYIGGYEAYYKDFKAIIAENKLQPCSNKSEFYQFSVLVKADASINFIKDLNEKYVASNKCASDLAREVAKYQTNWKSAEVGGEKVAAVANFIIYPDDLFKDQNDNYVPQISYPRYDNQEKNHMDYFRKQLIANLDLKRFQWNDRFTVEAEFIISKEGKMKDIVLKKKTGQEEFDRMIFYAFKDMKKKWKPATINGVPIDFRFQYMLTATTDPKN